MYRPTSYSNRYRRFARLAGSLTAGVGLLAIAVWLSDVGFFGEFPSGFFSIKINGAVCILLSGISLWLLAAEHSSQRKLLTSNILAATTASLGILTLVGYASGREVPLLQQLLTGSVLIPAQNFERISIAGGAVFTLLGSALFLLGRNAPPPLVEGTTLLALGNMLVPALGYLYGKSTLYQVPYFDMVSLPMAPPLILLCMGILAARPERGLMALLTNDSAGGITARRLLPAALFLPVAIERLQYWGYRNGLYDHDFGTILIVLSSMLIFTILIFWNARLLLRLDEKRGDAEDAFRQTLDMLETNLHALTNTNSRLLAEANERRAISLKMSYLAEHDPLTDLPNRFLLNDRLSQAIALALHHGNRAALLFFDLDRFKHVNDTLGHMIGDRLLQEVAARLVRCRRETDTISRQGGDEFVILLPEVNDTYAAARAATEVLTSITTPFSIEGHEIHLTASIGISICPEDGEDSETMVKHAEAAMYQAKAQGRNNYQFFTRRINEKAVKRFALEGNLRRAIAREESALYYQPKLRITDRAVIGSEALIRWNSRHDGFVSPAQFIPIAEESGLIIPIGEWVLRSACRQNRAWQDAGYPALPVSVNVSAVQFKEKTFIELVARVLEETGLDPHCLELELTESVTMQDLELTTAQLELLKRMGVSLSIDDFGTGYSSLSYLKRFPIDTLKIDRSFIQDVTTDPDSAAITCAIISMAKSLKLTVIAEGVENEEQFAFLRTHGCDGIQGFYFSQPLTAQDFEHTILQAASMPTQVRAASPSDQLP
ncbi:MAG TPA: EAL domain-containing protein [Noviherbaspirillum sp.]|nr:EAL domain-containing protein [Noviherbaspirillum sp.]